MRGSSSATSLGSGPTAAPASMRAASLEAVGAAAPASLGAVSPEAAGAIAPASLGAVSPTPEGPVSPPPKGAVSPTARGAGGAGRQARQTTPVTARIIPRPISSHHTHPPHAPLPRTGPGARWSAPVARTRSHVAASPGSTSTIGGPGSSAANAQGDGALSKGRQPSAENGSWTPLMA
jgi:hypothetical protein